MPKIELTGFFGGKNSRDHQILIPENQCASGSFNVWAPYGYLTHFPGNSVVACYSATANSINYLRYDPTVNPSFDMYFFMATATGGQFPWAGEVTGGDSLTPLGYTTGTVSVSGASLISATGNGTSWLTHVTAGDLFRVNSTAASWYAVSSVEDDTHLTLGTAVAVAVATGASYTIIPKSSAVPFYNVTLNGSWIMSTTADWMQRYNSTGMTRIQAGPKAAFGAVFKNYAFAARTNTAESRLYWSAVKDTTSWPTNNFIDVEPTVGKINGLKAFGNELIVFKTRGMYKVVGEVFDPANPTYAVYPISVPSGFAFGSPNSPAPHVFGADDVTSQSELLIFFAQDGLYAYRQGTSYISKISSRYYSDLPKFFNDPDYLYGGNNMLHGLSFNGNYFVKGIITSDSIMPKLGLLDSRGAWWSGVVVSGSGISASSSPFYGGAGGGTMLAVPGNASKPPRLFMTSGTSPARLYEFDVIGPDFEEKYVAPRAAGETLVNQTVQMTWVSKEFNIGFGHFKTIVVYFEKQSTTSDFELQWKIDQGTAVSNTIDMTVGRGNLARKTLDINQRGSTIQLIINKTSYPTVPIRIYAIEVYYDPILENRQV